MRSQPDEDVGGAGVHKEPDDAVFALVAQINLCREQPAVREGGGLGDGRGECEHAHTNAVGAGVGATEENAQKAAVGHGHDQHVAACHHVRHSRRHAFRIFKGERGNGWV